MASKKVKLMFDGVSEECLVRTDANGETVCYARSGRIAKFGGIKTDKDLAKAVKLHNDHNKQPVVLAEDVDDGPDAELEAWLGIADQASEDEESGLDE